MSLIDQFKKIFILTNEKKLNIFIIIILFLVSSLIDITGIAILGLYISFIIGNIDLSEYTFIKTINLNINFNKQDIIIYLSIILFVIFSLKTFLSLIIQYFIILFSNKKMANLRMRLIESYKSLNYISYIERDTSEFITSVSNHIKNYGSLLQSTLQFISDTFIVIFISILLINIDWKVLILVSTIIYFFILFYKKFFLNKTYYYGKIVNEAYKNLYQNINEMFYGFKEIRIINKFYNFEKNIFNSTYNIVNADTKKTFIETAPRYLLEFLVILISLLLVFLSLFLYGNLEKSLTTISFFIASFLRLAPMAYQFTRHISVYKYTKNSIDIIYKDYETIISTKKTFSKSIDLKFDEVIIKNLSFSYPKSKNYVFKNINLKFTKGQAIGIIGSSGTGKTTLIDIIIGLLPYEKGSIMINSKELSSIENIQSWRDLFYYLPQEVFIINDTLKKNIALGLDEVNIDENKVNECIKKANLQVFKEKLEFGLDTNIGERGINISGGQKQRIAIARSFYFDKQIIIFDEGTSSLDNKTENKIIEEIYQLKKTKTLIIISHNENTIKNCDVVYNIDKL